MVRQEVRAVLDSPKVRELIWRAVENQFTEHRWAMIGQGVLLFVRRRSVRRLAWALHRHGVLGELRSHSGRPGRPGRPAEV